MNKWTAVLFLIILCQCDNSDPTKTEKCEIDNNEIVGTWTLIKECNCYSLGGDFIWKNATIDWTLSFDINCNIIEGGEDFSVCSNQGKFIINEEKLTTIFTCPNGGKTTNPYEYSISSNNDTLTLKGFVDEGYFGYKLLRQ